MKPASKRSMLAFATLFAIGLEAAASASETITYGYDARGRLVQVTRAGTVNNNVVTTYTHDKADNRLSKTVTGAPAPFVVVPLGGDLVLIPVDHNPQ